MRAGRSAGFLEGLTVGMFGSAVGAGALLYLLRRGNFVSFSIEQLPDVGPWFIWAYANLGMSIPVFAAARCRLPDRRPGLLNRSIAVRWKTRQNFQENSNEVFQIDYQCSAYGYRKRTADGFVCHVPTLRWTAIQEPGRRNERSEKQPDGWMRILL